MSSMNCAKKIARKMIDEGIVEFKSQTVYEPVRLYKVFQLR